MQDVYDLFYDVNTLLHACGLRRMDDLLRQTAMSGIVSDLLTASLAKHSRGLTANRFFDVHPALVVAGEYPSDAVRSGTVQGMSW